jgi:hypothetical protein
VKFHPTEFFSPVDKGPNTPKQILEKGASNYFLITGKLAAAMA